MQTMNQTDFGMPVYNLQRMLRTIFQTNGMEPEVIPDGFYNETTEAAVKHFQQMNNIEPSGVVDNNTWDLIAEAYDIAVIEGNEPIGVQLFVREDFKVANGQKRARYAVMQAMLQVMNQRFENLPYVEITGVYDAQTVRALDRYRELFGLPEGEGVDNQLWYHLVKAYESAVLPYDFETPEKNAFMQNEARQQIDTSRRSENSMSDRMPDERLSMRTQQTPINRMPMLDSYQSIRGAREAEAAQETVEPSPPNGNTQMKPEMPKPNNKARSPIKWNF